MTKPYRSDDVQQILQLAMARKAEQGEFSREQLLEMAAELGISPETVEEAEQQWMQLQQEQQARKAFKAHRRRRFQKHLFSYLCVNTFLTTIDAIQDGRLDWAFWPLLGWGLGLAIHGWNTYQIPDRHYEKIFQNWQSSNRSKK